VEPCEYYGYLAFGILMAIMSILMMTHIFRHIVLIVDGKTMGPFLETPLVYMRETYAQFLAIVFQCLIGFYFLYCTHKGQCKIGQRFYTIQSYPIVKN
jgi:hypothetical protein